MLSVLMFRFFLGLAIPALVLAAPTADEILSKARKAIGKVDGLQSLTITGSRKVAIETPNGAGTMTRGVEMDFLLPDKFLKGETIELPNGMEGPTLMEGLDGGTSWRDTRNMPTGGHIMIRTAPPPGAAGEGPAADQARTRMFRNNFLRTLLLYTLTPPAGANLKFDLIGEAEASDGKAWMLDVSGADGFALRIFIDQKTNLPLMATWRALQAPRAMIRTMMGPPSGDHKKLDLPEPPKPKEVEFETRLSEYADFGSVKLPKLMVVSAEGKLAEEFELQSAKINPKIKPDKFRK